MTTLYKRANGLQMRMLRIVSGAVLNAAHAHPEVVVDKRFARSVSKRAVGTLSAQFADVLATSGTAASDNVRGQVVTPRRSSPTPVHRRWGEAHFIEPRPFSSFCQRLGQKISPMRASGDVEGVEAIRAAIHALAPLARRETSKPTSKANT
jgi:hypothetical protein